MSRLSFLLVFVSLSAGAAESPTGTTIQIYRDDIRPRTIVAETYDPLTTIRSRTPHRELNGDGKTTEFEGISIKQLLNLTPRDEGTFVHFVGVDGYISTIPASVLLKTNAILALRENGTAIAERRGGIQVVFPTEGKDAVETRYAKKAAFWCWYVRSIVVGDLPNHLSFADARRVALASDAFSYEPPSVFQFEKTPCPEVARVPLSDLMKSKQMALHLLSGLTKTVQTESFDVLIAKTKQALPVSCGGPFALADRNKIAALKQPILGKELELGVASIEER